MHRRCLHEECEATMETTVQEDFGFLYILKRAAKLISSNTTLLVLSFFCSLPLFCFLIFFELSLQKTLFLASDYLLRQGYSWIQFYSGEEPMSETHNTVAWQMIQTCLLYFIPYHFLDLFTATAIVGASSIVYTSKEQMGLGLLVRRSIDIVRNRFRGCLVTSLYVLLFSTSVLVGFIFTATNYYYCVYLFRRYDIFDDPIFIYPDGNNYLYNGQIGVAALLRHLAMLLLHGALFVVLAAIVSVLEADKEEAVYGSDALSLSACYSRGHERLGLWLMLVFFANALVLRLPCLYSKCNESHIGVVYTCLYAGLICVGNVFKWVSCVVLYREARTRVLEKKADLEVARDNKPSVM